MRRFLISIAGAAVFAWALGAGTAEGAVKTIWPDNLEKVREGGAGLAISPTRIDGEGYLSVPLRLPVGARILGAKVFYESFTGDFNYCVYVIRRRVNQQAEKIIDWSPADAFPWTPEVTTAESTPDVVDGSIAVVRRGYRYYMEVELMGTGALYGVQVIYRR